eukprot:974586-Prymnesium_polylepis.1
MGKTTGVTPHEIEKYKVDIRRDWAFEVVAYHTVNGEAFETAAALGSTVATVATLLDTTLQQELAEAVPYAPTEVVKERAQFAVKMQSKGNCGQVLRNEAAKHSQPKLESAQFAAQCAEPLVKENGQLKTRLADAEAQSERLREKLRDATTAMRQLQ